MNRRWFLVIGVCVIIVGVAFGIGRMLPSSDSKKQVQQTVRKSSRDPNQKSMPGVESILHALVFDGPELHESLSTRPMDDSVRHLPEGLVMPGNPHVSTDPEVVRAICRGGSQGRLDEFGARAVLYAVYTAEKEVGFYGIEAETISEADLRESRVRNIWVHNVSLGRASVFRKGVVILVIWTDGVTPECWEAINAKVSERLRDVPLRAKAK